MKAITKLKPNLLRACAMIAPGNDIRYYLNGVRVELEARETRYVACDGHKLVVIRQERSERDGPQEPGCLIIPKEVISAIPKVRLAGLVVDVELHYDTEAVGVECRLGNTLFKPIEGKFPEYRKVIPAQVSGELGQYNPAYMMEFQRAATAAFGQHALVELWQNGSGAALVLIGRETNFVGVVMPLRSESAGKAPTWALPTPEPVKAPETAPDAANAERAMAAAE